MSVTGRQLRTTLPAALGSEYRIPVAERLADHCTCPIERCARNPGCTRDLASVPQITTGREVH
jgi:hypothetical protein